MATKNTAAYSKYAYRKAPTDNEFHYIINEVAYVEDMINKLELAYDNDLLSTISLLARYYRNYKGLEKTNSEDIILDYIERYYRDKLNSELIAEYSWVYKKIQHACSKQKFTDNHGYKPLRDFSGISITQNEIDTIRALETLEEQEVLFCVLCFTKMYNEQNKRQGRKVNNLFYVDTGVIRRCIGWKKGTKDKVEETIRKLTNNGFISFIENRDKYGYAMDKNRQPFITKKCNVVAEGAEVLYVDCFDTLGLTWQFLMGNKNIRKCECGRYFAANSNRQIKCKKCNPQTAKPKKKPLQKMGKRK